MSEQAYRHILFFNLEEKVTSDKIEKIKTAFLEIKGKDGITDVTWAENVNEEKASPDTNIIFRKFTYVVSMTFENKVRLDEYLKPSKNHQAIQDIFVPLLVEIAVVDYALS